MVEWSIAPVLKTGMPQGIVGSNPTPSAISSEERALEDGSLGNLDRMNRITPVAASESL